MLKRVALAAFALSAVTTLSACGGSDSDSGTASGSDSASTSTSASTEASASASASASAGSTGDYCADLKSAKKYFAGLNSDDPKSIQAALDQFHTLAQESPSEISGDWKTVDGAFQKLQTSLKSAGVTIDQFTQFRNTGKPPAGVDPAAIQKVVQSVQTLAGADFDKASQAITKQGKQACGVDLG